MKAQNFLGNVYVCTSKHSSLVPVVLLNLVNSFPMGVEALVLNKRKIVMNFGFYRHGSRDANLGNVQRLT